MHFLNSILSRDHTNEITSIAISARKTITAVILTSLKRFSAV